MAVLDPRLVTARYGAFLKASLPPMWTTTDPALVRKALAAAGRIGLTAAKRPPATTTQPPTASSTQWLPVPTITSAVMIACVQPSGAQRGRLRWPRAAAPSATHSAQPACMDGNAASWLVSQPIPCGAEGLAPTSRWPACSAIRST